MPRARPHGIGCTGVIVAEFEPTNVMPELTHTAGHEIGVAFAFISGERTRTFMEADKVEDLAFEDMIHQIRDERLNGHIAHLHGRPQMRKPFE